MSTPNGRQPNTSPSPSGSQPVLPNGGKLVTGSLGSLSGLRGQQHPLMGRAGGMYSSEKPVPVDSTMRATAYSSRMPTSSANGVPGTKVGSSAITPVNAGANSRGTDISSSRGAIASQPLRGRNVVTLKESAKKPTVFKDSGSSRALSGLHSSDAGSARGARRDIQDGSEHERNRGTTDRDQEKDKSRGRSDRDREFERHGRVGRDTSRDRHTHRDASLRAGGSGSGSVRGADAGIGKRLYSPHASPKRSGTPISSQHSQSHTQHTQPMLSTAAAPLDAPSLVQGKGGTAQNYRVAGRPWANDSTGVGGAYTLSSSSQQSQVSGILPNYTQMRAQAFARGVAPNAQQALQADVQYQSTNRMGTAALTRGSAKERPGNSSGSSSTPMILQRKPQPQPQQQPQLNAGDSGRRDRGADGSRMPTVHAQQSMRHSSASAADPYAQRSRLGTGLGASTASKADGRTHQHAATQPPPPVSAQLQAPRVSQTRRVCSEPLRLVSKRFTFVGAAAKKVLVDAGDDCLVVGVMGTEGSDKAAVMESLIEYHTGIDPRASADRNDVGRDKGVERGSMRGTDEGITLRIAPRALFLDAAPVSVDVLDRAKDLVAHLGRGDTISGQYMGGRKDSQVGSAYGDSDSSLQKTARKSTSESASMAGVLRTEDSLVVRKVALLLSVCHVVVFVQPHPTSSMSLGFGSDLSSGRTPGSVNSFCWGGVLQRSAALLAPLHKHELASVYGKLTGTPAEDPQGSTGIQTGGQCGTSARGELVPTQNRYRNPKARVSDTESMSVMSDVYATLFDDFDPTSASLHPSLLFAYTNTPVWAFDALPKAEVFASLKSGLIGTRWAYKGAGAACYRKHLHTCVCPVISDNTGGLVSDERCGTSDEEMQDTLAASDGPVEAKSPSANSTHRGITPVQSTHRFVCCGSERGAHCCHSMFMAPVTGTKANLGPNRTENDTGATAWTSWVKRNSSWNSYSDAATYAFGRKSADSVNEQLVQTVLSTPRYAYPERTDCVTW
ncbi:hypothetical protein, variant [Sphaeroforma arctica JP610]|nr:hypothetical protein, variant [Sphaeroforma arctica JP610]KNC78549.1 hypothetical protein, variant [Sphaeroforma arctica JP610]|eukprot:XP_014152451.1 hypothetical protein, variant [Sphaeroforma arctica JP610]